MLAQKYEEGRNEDANRENRASPVIANNDRRKRRKEQGSGATPRLDYD